MSYVKCATFSVRPAVSNLALPLGAIRVKGVFDIKLDVYAGAAGAAGRLAPLEARPAAR